MTELYCTECTGHGVMVRGISIARSYLDYILILRILSYCVERWSGQAVGLGDSVESGWVDGAGKREEVGVAGVGERGLESELAVSGR